MASWSGDTEGAQSSLRIGVSCVAEDIDAFRARVRAIDELGFDRLGVGDSPAFGDAHVSLGIAAEATQRVLLGPLVTNPITRWLGVTARAIRTLQEASGGRAYLGIGTGDSAVRAAGRAMASLRELSMAVSELRAHGLGSPDGPPVMVAANGPRALQLAGALADEVLFGGSLLSKDLEDACTHVRTGADRVDRDTPPPLWVVNRGWVTSDPERDAAARDTLLASAANHAFARHIPDDLGPSVAARIQLLQRRYDFSAHGVEGPNPNGRLVQELGLREILSPRFGWVTTPADFARRLRGLVGKGVTGVIIPAVGDKPDLLIHRLGHQVIAGATPPDT